MGVSTLTLDCADPVSVALFEQLNVCEAGGVANCCCEEFFRLERITGSVVLAASEVELRPSNLQQVLGDIRAVATNLSTVGLDSVTALSGSLVLASNPMLTSVHLGSVSEIAGHVVITNNTALTRVSPAFVQTIGGDILLHDNDLHIK